MENPDSKDDRPADAAPAPTHWNVFRDPQWSFACPKCKAHVELNVPYDPVPAFPDMIALCLDCNIAFMPDAWERMKLEEKRGR